jgi:chemotaxis protein methyltransferase CheR
MALPLIARNAEGGTGPEIEEIELQIFLEGLRRLDDREYGSFAQGVLRRRIAERMRAERAPTITALLDRILHDPDVRARFVASMGGGHRALFHDPGFFAAFRSHVAPLLQTYAFVRIWLPGVGSGEDAYSLACVLEEAGLLDRCVLYATASADESVAIAREGTYRVSSRGAFAAAATAAGLERDVDAIAQLRGTTATFPAGLRKNIMFARHDVASDASLNEFHAIVSRGVVPNYNGETQYRIHRLFYESLGRLGFLCLGNGERLDGTVYEGAYRRVVPDHAIYRRMR